MQAIFGPKLNRSQWDRLGPQAQQIWDQLDGKAKKIILEGKLLMNKSISSNSHNRDTQSHERQINNHAFMLDWPADEEEIFFNAEPQDKDKEDEKYLINQLIANKKSKTEDKMNPKSPPGDIAKLLSAKQVAAKKSVPEGTMSAHHVMIDGKVYRQVNQTITMYRASPHRMSNKGAALVDRGCNGGICGNDVRVISKTHRTVNIQGIDNHRMNDMPVVTAGAVVNTQKGEAIIIMHQYAFLPQAHTIHSCAQMEANNLAVNDRSLKIPGGLQQIETPHGMIIPLNIRDGLPYMTLRPFTDHEWEDLPHILLTQDNDWEPSILDHEIEDKSGWQENLVPTPRDDNDRKFDDRGYYRRRVLVQDSRRYDANPNITTDKTPDFEALRKHFGWVPKELVRRTYDVTTRMARLPMTTRLTRHFKSPYPALNIPRRQEDIATNTVYSNTPAIDDGATIAQFYIGTKSYVSDVFGMKNDREFVNTLEDIIWKRGAPSRLLSDHAQVETSQRAKDILRAYVIGDWQSEPHQQQQNPAERHYQTVKRMTNTIMDRTGSPPYTWLLAMQYVSMILNHVSHKRLNDRTPLEALTGITPDVSPFLRFTWWEPVLYKIHDGSFPSDSQEKAGHFVGIAETVGHSLTYRILSDDTQKVILRSSVRTAVTDTDPNIKASIFDGEPSHQYVKSTNGESQGNVKDTGMMVIKPEDMIGRTFLMDPQEDGQRFRAKIVEAIEDHDAKTKSHPRHIKFRCAVNGDQYEEIIAYNDIVNKIETDAEDENIWKFKKISGHQGPLATNHPSYKGSKFNVLVEWETGEITSEPLNVIAADDPVSCAIYAKDNGLLEQEGWKRFRSIAKNQKKMTRMINQAKLKSYRRAPKYMFGVRIPRDYDKAMVFDKNNGNTKWKDCTVLEMKQLDDYDTFQDEGKGAPIPKGYKKIRVHLVYAVKHDSRHKARLVADGHLTDVPLKSVYSGVVSIRGLRMMIFLAELNGLQIWATDIGNAYLEAETAEKLAIIAGLEFGPLQGHTLIIFKALYGLRTSGLRWHERLSAVLCSEGFQPSWAEPDIWMRPNDGKYEYVAVYVDDLAIAMKNPQELIQVLKEKYKFKLKGTGEISFHLGADFFRDKDGVLCMAPRKYVERIAQGYERMFGTKPKTKGVTLVHYVNANLYYCALTGRSVTGILHLINQTPIEWYAKKQATVETATYGSEFVAARTAIEQIIDMRNTLQYLGVPVRGKSYLFGDNESVVGSSIRIDAKLHKRHSALSFHRVREAIAAGIVIFTHLPGENNPADILSKHWGYAQIWPLLRVLLFWWGDTQDTDRNNEG